MKKLLGSVVVVICISAINIFPAHAQYIVDTGGGGGTSLSWRDAGDERPGPRWSGNYLFF